MLIAHSMFHLSLCLDLSFLCAVRRTFRSYSTTKTKNVVEVFKPKRCPRLWELLLAYPYFKPLSRLHLFLSFNFHLLLLLFLQASCKKWWCKEGRSCCCCCKPGMEEEWKEAIFFSSHGKRFFFFSFCSNAQQTRRSRRVCVCELLRRGKKGIWVDAETMLLLICSSSFY